MKKRLILLFVIFCLIFLCGCWDRLAPEKQATVIGGGFDYNPDTNMYKVIFQIVSPLTMTGAGGQASGGSEKPNYWTVSAWGHSPYDALSNIYKKTSRKISFDHAQIYLFSKKMAQTKGILPIVNAVARSRQSRKIITLGIVEKDIEKLLTVKYPIESNNVMGLTRQIELTMEEMGGPTAQTIRDFMIRLVQPGLEPYVVALELTKNMENKNNKEVSNTNAGTDAPIRIIGKYMFKDDKIVSLLDDRETRGCNWISGTADSGTLLIEYPDEEEKIIDILINHGESRIIPLFKNGEPTIKVKIKAQGRIVNITGTSEIKEKSQITLSIKKRMAQVIRNDVEKGLRKAKRFKSDLFGFGFAFYRLMPDKWDQMKEDWDNIFATLPVEVEIETEVERTGLVNSGPDIQ